MKVRTKINFVEIPFQVFIKNRPDALELFPPQFRDMLLSDPDYIVRLSDDGFMEVGYKSDNWSIR